MVFPNAKQSIVPIAVNFLAFLALFVLYPLQILFSDLKCAEKVVLEKMNKLYENHNH